jgi:hydroxymethylbilane synthase
MSKLRIATRNSPLALWQAHYVQSRLLAVHSDLEVEIVSMTTSGDQLLDRKLNLEGGKGLFLKELEVSLLANETDIAVHSMKDVPAEMPEGLELTVVCERADPRDAFVSNNYATLASLPKGAIVGTSSLRRVSLLRNRFPELEFKELRGNVNTRLQKLDRGDYDAIILAVAGLERLGLEERINERITPSVLLPAVGQGIVGIECRSGDERIKQLIAPLHDEVSYTCLLAERAMSAKLEGGCHAPIAGFAVIENNLVWLRGRVAAQDGSKVLLSDIRLPLEDTKIAGNQVAESLFEQGAAELLSLDAPHLEAFDDNSKELDEMQALGLQKPQQDDAKFAENGIVVLTRPSIFLGYLPQMLERLDYSVLNVPTLHSTALDISETDRQLLSAVDRNSDLIFVSRNAVNYGVPLLQQFADNADQARFMSVGEGSARELYDLGFDSFVPNEGVGSEALIESINSDVENGLYAERNVIIFRSPRGLNTLSTYFKRHSISVTEVMCYEMTPSNQLEQQIAELAPNLDRIVGVFLHSADSAASLMAVLQDHGLFEQARDLPLVVGGERIKDYIESQKWLGKITVATTPSNTDMLMAFSKTNVKN